MLQLCIKRSSMLHLQQLIIACLFLSLILCHAEHDVEERRQKERHGIGYKKETNNKQFQNLPRSIASKPLLDPIPMLPKVTHKVYLDIEITPYQNKGKMAFDTEVFKGRIVLGLFGTHAPLLTSNFKALCECTTTTTTTTITTTTTTITTSNDKKNRNNGGIKPLCYQGSTFHRVIPNFMMQGGDITNHDGTGGATIYEHDIVDESTNDQFNRKYLLASANRGYKNSNTSQFFITTVKTQWLGSKHVVFGVVMDGVQVVRHIETLGTNGGKPRQIITIVDTGVLQLSPEEESNRIPVSLHEPFLVRKTTPN